MSMMLPPGLPPGLGAGPGAPAPGAGGPPPSIQLGGGQSDGPDNAAAAAALRRAASDMQAFVAAESDPQDKSIGAQILAKIHSITAGRAKEHESAIGMSPALKMVQRANGGSPPQPSSGAGY